MHTYINALKQMGVIIECSGIGNMWKEESQKKTDPQAILQRMSLCAERQKSMGYLTTHVLAVLDTRLSARSTSDTCVNLPT